jgi:glycosyltransferase involved in cell wall biosynthesis
MNENKKISELSIFFPFWNEEKNVKRVTENAIAIAKEVSDRWEIILVDDGSTDKTLEEAKNIARGNRNIRVISHKPNRGYGAALKAGFEASKYKYVVFADGDGQFDFSEISLLIDAIRGNDLAIGFRKKRHDEKILIRLLLMYLLKIWDFVLFRFLVKDIDCGFKLFKKDALEKITPLRSEGAMITTEILAKAKARNLKIAEVGVHHFPRKYGKQSGANLQVIVRAVIESFILWWDIKYNRF